MLTGKSFQIAEALKFSEYLTFFQAPKVKITEGNTKLVSR